MLGNRNATLVKSVRSLNGHHGLNDLEERSARIEKYRYLLEPQYDYRSVVPETLPLPGPVGVWMKSKRRHFVHSFGALSCLDELVKLLGDQGFALIADCGTRGTNDDPGTVSSFGRSRTIGVNFAELEDRYDGALSRGWMTGPGDEDSEDPLIIRLLVGSKQPSLRQAFAAHYSWGRIGWEEEATKKARQLATLGHYEAALRNYEEALRRNPDDWAILEEVADFALTGLHSYGVSKKLANLKHSMALFIAHFNFCRVHSAHKQTPAMAAKLTNHQWTIEELFLSTL